MKDILLTLVIDAGLTSVIIGFGVWFLQERINAHWRKKEKADEERKKVLDSRERNREQNEFLLIQSVTAAIALGEATARAVQRIPDAHCNGDMHAALAYADKVKSEQKDFLTKKGIEALYD